MPRSIPALANPRLLHWARESAGLDLSTAAKKIGRSEDELRAWESGQSRPTIAQLREAARVYRRPSAAFYLPDPPPDLSLLRDLRRLPAGVPRAFSPQLRFLIRSARERQRWLQGILSQLGQAKNAVVGSAAPREEPDSVAAKARAALGIGVEDQRSWPTVYQALREWLSALEDAGVFVFQSSDVDVAEMRGFALPDALAPVLVLNGKDAPSARVFSALHEFVHVLLDEGGVSNLELVYRPRSREEEIEVFCNGVAGRALVPRDALEEALMLRARLAGLDRLIPELADSFKVSREVMARRLLDLGQMNREAYEARRNQYRREFEDRDKPKEEFPFPPYRRAVRDNGRAFTRLVLSSHARALITSRDVSRLLNVRVKHLPKIEAAVFPTPRGRPTR